MHSFFKQLDIVVFIKVKIKRALQAVVLARN